jgi:hypothetical protein
MKKSFLIHLDSLEILDELSDEQIAKLFKAIRSYHLGLEPKLDQILRIAFKPFQLQFERDSEKYEQTSARNSLNGSKGGRPKKQENPVGFSGLSQKREKPLKAKKADSDSDSDSDSVSDSKSVSKIIKTEPEFRKALEQYEPKYGLPMIMAFCNYWTETDQKGKMRFQDQKFFDIAKRLATWNSKNQKNATTSFPGENSAAWRPAHHKSIDFSNTIETK